MAGGRRRALQERTDLIAARKRLEVTDYNLKYFKNQTLPGLDLQFDYNATGLGGTQLIRDPDARGSRRRSSATSRRGYWRLMKDVLRQPSSRRGSSSLNVNYPIGNEHRRRLLARAKVEKRQSDISLRDLELQVAAAGP